MSDRTSAGLFGRIFETLHALTQRNGLSPIIAKELALDFWALTEDYDFSWYQMGCDEALFALGLARRVGVGTDDEHTAYLGDDDFEAGQ
jgi:hypothetical protein